MQKATIKTEDYKHAKQTPYMQPIYYKGRDGENGKIVYVYLPPGSFMPIESNGIEVYGISRLRQKHLETDDGRIELMWVET